MTHPNTEFFLKQYQQVPQMTLMQLHETYEVCATIQEYALLRSFTARTMANQAQSHAEALDWVNKSLKALNRLEGQHIYGSDQDFLSAIQSCLSLKISILSESDDMRHWNEGIQLAQDILQTKYPSIFTKDLQDGHGASMACSLVSLYNRVEQYDKAMHLCERIQKAAQERQVSTLEFRAGLLWSITSLLIGKLHRIEDRREHFINAVLSARKVLEPIKDGPDEFAMTAEVLWDYTFILDGSATQPFLSYVDQWSEHQMLIIFDLLNEHSSEQDGELMSQIQHCERMKEYWL